MKKKLVEYQRIKNMNEERMVKKVIQEAEKLGAKNIFTETEIRMEELGINIIEVTKLNKNSGSK